MAIPEDHISAQLLSRLEGQSNKEKWGNLSREYPWYPLPWLMLAETDAEKQKAALWFKNEHRIHWLLTRGDSGAKPFITSSSPSAIEEDLPAEAPTSAADTIGVGQNIVAENGQHSTESIEDEDYALKFSTTIQHATDFLPEVAGQEALDIPLEEEEIKEELEAPAEAKAEEGASTEPVETEPVEDTKTEAAPSEPVENEVTAAEPSVLESKEEKPAAEEKLVFEPLYTTDYFASQGIKVDPNSIPKTKLDRQVKSFTQWLKTMKKVGPETSSAADPLVDAQASASVQEKDVITEAMVAVLEKQGKYQKAIDTLGKLILLHPEKSAFFAAQIENLKAKQ